MSSSYKNYNDAKTGYDNAVTNYKTSANTYTGNTGYNNSLNQASTGMAVSNDQAKKYATQMANAQAQNTANAVQTQARNSGMSKAQASALGGQSVANSFNNAYGNAYNTQLGQFNNQQGNVMNAGNNQLSAQGNLVNSNQQQQGYASQQDDKTFNRWMTGLGTTLGSVGNVATGIAGIFSDERLKNYVDVSTNFFKNLDKNKVKKYANLAVNALDIGNDIYQLHNQKRQEKTGQFKDWNVYTGSVLPTIFSDERLKNYFSVTKKLSCKTPKGYKSLMWKASNE
ncbi:MAG: hypothetical protein MJ174_07455 [Treponema sp.]|nr:hypothetical protein [Treponema sp.]